MRLTDPIFTDADKAREHLEATRWADGVFCPHCGVTKVRKLEGASARPGTFQCNGCRGQFTVTVGTVFERSKVPLNKWLLASYLVASSKKGISAHQISRQLEVTYKTAWFMMHRIREAMRTDGGPPFGEGGGGVEIDETFIGKDTDAQPNRMAIRMMCKVVSLIDRATGRAKSVVVDDLKPATLWPIVAANVSREANLITDEASHYKAFGKEFASHKWVSHSRKEYVKAGEPQVHTNTIEGFFGVFKRGMKGVYQHCGKAHLHRYMAEFDFRYSNRSALGIDDGKRTDNLLRQIEGKRLTYRRIGEAAYA
jgi:transposase-like protein